MRKQPLQDVIVKPRIPRDGPDMRPPHDFTPPPPRTSRVRPPQDPIREAPPYHEHPHEYAVREEPAHERHSTSEANHLNVPPQRHDFGRSARRGAPWLILALAIGAVIIAVSFILSLLWSGASVTIYPRHERTTVNAQLPSALEPQPGELRYSIFTIERTQTREVEASSLEDAQEQARGRITVFNEFSESSQRLITKTRFTAPDGKVYRIRESIVVPGKKADGTPGSLEVDVFAEEAGEAYNKPATTFTLPGLVGLPQEGKVYARSVGDITGGFVGERRTVGEAERTRAYDEMRAALRDELLAAATAEGARPEGTLLYGDAVFYELTPGPDAPAGDNAVKLTMTGRLHAVLLAQDEFAKYLATQAIAGYDGNPVRIENPSELAVSAAPLATSTEDADEEGEVAALAETAEPWNAQRLTLTVRGDALFIWEYDEAALTRDLAGQAKSRMFEPPQTSILSAYPGIDRAEASIRPFWKGSFPEDPADITITTSLDS